jgi:hypothetical protein
MQRLEVRKSGTELPLPCGNPHKPLFEPLQFHERLPFIQSLAQFLRHFPEMARKVL